MANDPHPSESARSSPARPQGSQDLHSDKARVESSLGPASADTHAAATRAAPHLHDEPAGVRQHFGPAGRPHAARVALAARPRRRLLKRLTNLAFEGGESSPEVSEARPRALASGTWAESERRRPQHRLRSPTE